MKEEYIINALSAESFQLSKDDIITITDIEGHQVVDFFAINRGDFSEYFSPGVTIDCNESLAVKNGDRLFTNLYQPMFFIKQDDVQSHDLLHPCCRPEMYDYFYYNGKGHPNCLENINFALKKYGIPKFYTIRPFNIFMNAKVYPDGRIEVDAPRSKPGDSIALIALMDVIVCVAACSVSESRCNGGKCTPIKITMEDH